MAEMYSSRAVGNAGLTTGIIGTSLGAINSGLLGNLFGGNCGCSESMAVTRYEMGLEKEIAAKDSKISLLESTVYTDGKLNDLRNYVDRRLEGVSASINAQGVINAQVAANLSCMQGNVATLMGLTKTIVPVDNICPEPMKLYNSWVAPTSTATG